MGKAIARNKARKVKKKTSPKFYVITFQYGEPYLSTPFATEKERDEYAKETYNGEDFTQGQDVIGCLDIDGKGKPTVGTYTDADLSYDDGEE